MVIQDKIVKLDLEHYTAKLVANLITSAGAHRVLTMNLLPQIQGFLTSRLIIFFQPQY